MPLGDGRHACLPALLMGRTFTHRVSPTEIEHGFLDVSSDLEPLSLLTKDETYLRLLDGTGSSKSWQASTTNSWPSAESPPIRSRSPRGYSTQLPCAS